MTMMTVIAVALGGAAGAVSRFLVSHWMVSRQLTGFPVGTLTVNLCGCLLIGLVLGLLNRESGAWFFFIVTGFLGGFTTFSAFGADTIKLAQTGHVNWAILYVIVTNIGGMGLTAAGWGVARAFRLF